MKTMTDLTPERIAELRALLAKVTPGEWRVECHPNGYELMAGAGWLFILNDARRPNENDQPFLDGQEANARFIAAAKNALPALLDAAEENARLRVLLRGFLMCPEIADCAPEDKDVETNDLERRTRAALEAKP